MGMAKLLYRGNASGIDQCTKQIIRIPSQPVKLGPRWPLWNVTWNVGTP